MAPGEDDARWVPHRAVEIGSKSQPEGGATTAGSLEKNRIPSRRGVQIHLAVCYFSQPATGSFIDRRVDPGLNNDSSILWSAPLSAGFGFGSGRGKGRCGTDSFSRLVFPAQLRQAAGRSAARPAARRAGVTLSTAPGDLVTLRISPGHRGPFLGGATSAVLSR